MRILVFSDSHGTLSLMTQAVARHSPDAVLHLGDHAADAAALGEAFPGLTVRAVRGNCDAGGAPESRTLHWAGVCLYMTHGHRWRVKQGTDALVYAALEQGAQVALYGHTHVQDLRQVAGVQLLNPGAADRHYALLTLENGAAEVTLY